MPRFTFIFLLLLLLTGFEEHPRSLEQRLFAEINDARIARNLPPLRWSSKIAELAHNHSSRMMHHHFLSHNDPEYGDPGNRLSMGGVAWRACAENIYEGYGHNDPARAAVQSWLNSAGHRQNMLSRTYTTSGIGVVVNSQGDMIATQLFVAY